MDKIKILLFGISGKMGKHIIEFSEKNNCVVVAGFDRVPCPTIPTFSDVKKINVPYDVIVDFSRPETLDSIIESIAITPRPVVLATTGYDENSLNKIEELSKKVAVFQSGNMSLGINVISKLIADATRQLYNDFDIEIIEKHHNQKADSPSGTAKMLAAEVNKAMDEKANFVYGRVGANTLRKHNDVGIHSIRGGSIVGEHEVIFCGDDEVITISHTAFSRKIFANGALKAANFIVRAQPGKYSMKDIIG